MKPVKHEIENGMKRKKNRTEEAKERRRKGNHEYSTVHTQSNADRRQLRSIYGRWFKTTSCVCLFLPEIKH